MCIDCLQNQLIEATLRRLDQLDTSLAHHYTMGRVDGAALTDQHNQLVRILVRLERIETCLDSAGLNYSSAGENSPHPRHQIRPAPNNPSEGIPFRHANPNPDVSHPDPAPNTSRAASALADAIERYNHQNGSAGSATQRDIAPEFLVTVRDFNGDWVAETVTDDPVGWTMLDDQSRGGNYTYDWKVNDE